MSPLIVQIIGDDGTPQPFGHSSAELMNKLFPDQDKHRAMGTLHRTLATNIYKTKDGRFYHTHGIHRSLTL